MTSKKEILIHIGTHKTGTSSIQKSLTKAFRLGHLGGISYPLLMGKYHHRQIATLYYKNHQDLPRWFQFEYSPESFQEIKEACRSELFEKLNNSDKIILSSEYLEDFSPAQIKEFYADLSSLGEVKFRILIYVREPAAYYLSYIQQELKASSRFSAPQNFHYGFLNTIQLWGDVFSRQDLEIRLFQPMKFPGQSVIADFQRCASDFFKVKIELEKTIYLNKSLSAEGMIILKNYRQLFHPNADQIFKDDANTVISLLQSSISEIEQTKAELSREAAYLVRALHQEDIRKLKEIYNVDVSDFELVQNHRFQNSKYMQNEFENLEDVIECFEIKNMLDLMLWLLHKQITETEVIPSVTSHSTTLTVPVQEKTHPSIVQDNPDKLKVAARESWPRKFYKTILKWFNALLS